MFPYHITFGSPWYLLTLLVLPFLWWLSYRSLSGMRRVRRLLAIGLRSIVLVLLIFALAEAQLVRTSQDLTVMYLLDQSLSVPDAQIDGMLKYINTAIRTQRGRNPGDRAGVIVFGREAAIELPPLDDDQQVTRVESLVDREYTNLAGAMKLAQAAFPHDAAKRIVIISDGNENIGDAIEQARSLVDAGIGIDIVPIRSTAHGEVAVEKVTIPPDIRQGQPFDVRVVLNNTSPEGHNGGVVKGRLQILRRAGDREKTLAEESVTLTPGKHVLTIPREVIDSPDFYTYEARFVPDNPADDTLPQNNIATTFTDVRGRGRVLLIEDWENKGEFDLLVERLRSENLEVTIQPSNALFASLADLQPFDTVILANVPRTSGDDAANITNFSDEQIQMLVRNTQTLGCGLVMLGGPNSFGAGGWTNTPIEEAMPVNFQVKNSKVVPVGALVMLMHASEIPQGNFWQKKIAAAAIETLGNQDYCGVLHYGPGADEWLWGAPRGTIKVGGNRRTMLAKIDQMTPGDMPAFESSILMARNAFNRLSDAAVKHMIIISDGDPSAPNNSTLSSMKKMGVKVSTVAVGSHGPATSGNLRSIANATGGKYYEVRDPSALPRIYQKEARRVSRPLVYEKKEGFQPQVRFPHEMIQGISEALPPITGLVLTTIKDGPLVEVSLTSPLPVGQDNAVLASWTYGLGRAVAFTTDAGQRWATSWTQWESYSKLFSQVVRWSMRPVGDNGKFTIATEVQDGKIKVVVTALDKDDEFLNYLDMGGTVIGPDMKPQDLGMKQIAPGRYIGEVPTKDKGTYFVMIKPANDRVPIRAGVNIPYSDEFRDHETNEPLLKSLASLAPQNYPAGKIIEIPSKAADAQQQIAQMLEADTFRHDLPKATSNQDVWHLLVLVGSCLFFCDVFVRRVTISFAWVPPLAVKIRDRVLRRESPPVTSATMARLQSRKAEVLSQLEQKRAAVRFEPSAEQSPDAPSIEQELEMPVSQARPTRPAGAQLAPEKEQEEESYTSRLLKAKQKVWEERKKEE